MLIFTKLIVLYRVRERVKNLIYIGWNIYSHFYCYQVPTIRMSKLEQVCEFKKCNEFL